MKKFFQRIIRQPKRQLLLTLAAEVLAAVALGLFFAQGVTDAGGDGIATFRITFYSMVYGAFHLYTQQKFQSVLGARRRADSVRRYGRVHF